MTPILMTIFIVCVLMIGILTGVRWNLCVPTPLSILSVGAVINEVLDFLDLFFLTFSVHMN